MKRLWRIGTSIHTAVFPRWRAAFSVARRLPSKVDSSNDASASGRTLIMIELCLLSSKGSEAAASLEKNRAVDAAAKQLERTVPNRRDPTRLKPTTTLVDMAKKKQTITVTGGSLAPIPTFLFDCSRGRSSSASGRLSAKQSQTIRCDDAKAGVGGDHNLRFLGLGD
mmetsp:Transcript_24201/g.54908  ORF Transcript_24201/g.54908 Transcript_24201/m.54908 type:complete len:167 (-) Transcript_24201:26-526(-)